MDSAPGLLEVNRARNYNNSKMMLLQFYCINIIVLILLFRIPTAISQRLKPNDSNIKPVIVKTPARRDVMHSVT